jgi:hypothetical protein
VGRGGVGGGEQGESKEGVRRGVESERRGWGVGGWGGERLLRAEREEGGRGRREAGEGGRVTGWRGRAGRRRKRPRAAEACCGPYHLWEVCLCR